jgi:hypothetical protein
VSPASEPELAVGGCPVTRVAPGITSTLESACGLLGLTRSSEESSPESGSKSGAHPTFVFRMQSETAAPMTVCFQPIDYYPRRPRERGRRPIWWRETERSGAWASRPPHPALRRTTSRRANADTNVTILDRACTTPPRRKNPACTRHSQACGAWHECFRFRSHAATIRPRPPRNARLRRRAFASIDPRRAAKARGGWAQGGATRSVVNGDARTWRSTVRSRGDSPR